MSRIFRYLLNVRVIGIILANILWNQIKYLIRERVHYDKDLFNYEEYRQIGLSDKRLIKNALFMDSAVGSKFLVKEFFMYQKKRFANDSKLYDDHLHINTQAKLTHNLNLLSLHVENLFYIDQ